MARPWKELKDMVQLGLAQEWRTTMRELATFPDDLFDHRDTSLWKYILQTLQSLHQTIAIDSLVADYDPHPALLHAILCDIRLIGYDFHFAKFLETNPHSLSTTQSVSLHQTFQHGFPDLIHFEEWRNTYGLVTGRPVNAKGGLRSAPWLAHLYHYSTFRDEDYERAFLDFGYHRARPVETLGRLEMQLCSLVGGKRSWNVGEVGGDERWRVLGLCAAGWQWLRLAPL